MKNKKNKPANTIQKINELKSKRHEIDSELVKIRRKLSKNRNNFEYISKINKIEKFLNMDDDKKREYRFKQIKSNLNKNIYSFYKDKLMIIVTKPLTYCVPFSTTFGKSAVWKDQTWKD